MPAQGRLHSTRLALLAFLACAGPGVAGCLGRAPSPRPASVPTAAIDAGPSDAGATSADSSEAAAAATEQDAGGDTVALPQCPVPDYNFSSEPGNRLVIESACAPTGFSGTGRVRRIWRSERDGAILLIDVVLDAANACGGELHPI